MALSKTKLRREVDQYGAQFVGEQIIALLEKKELRPHECPLSTLGYGLMGGEWFDNLQPKSGRMPTAAELTEATGDVVASHMFNQITGQIFFTTVKDSYEMEDLPFSKVVPTKPSAIEVGMERIPGVSEVGDEFSVIGDAELYPNFGVSQDWAEIGPKQKRGGIIPVTKEAVRSDLTGGRLLERCRNLGKWMAINKEKRIIDAVVDENAGAISATLGGHRYHWKGTSYATFQTSTPWINVKTSNALVDYTDLENAWKVGRALLDPYTGEPIVFRPKHIVVTDDNYMTALRVMRSIDVRTHVGGYAVTGNLVDYTGPNPVNEAMPGLGILNSALLATRTATDTDWWIGDVSRAVNYFENWGIESKEAPADNQEDFRRDVLHQFKVSEKGIAAVVEPRAILESRA